MKESERAALTALYFVFRHLPRQAEGASVRAWLPVFFGQHTNYSTRDFCCQAFFALFLIVYLVFTFCSRARRFSAKLKDFVTHSVALCAILYI